MTTRLIFSQGLDKCGSFLLTDILVKSALLLQRLPVHRLPLPTKMLAAVEADTGSDADGDDEGATDEPSLKARVLQRRRGNQLQAKLSPNPAPHVPKPQPLESLRVRKFAKELCLQRSVDMLSSPEQYKFIGFCARLMIEGDTPANEAEEKIVSPASPRRVEKSGKSKYPHVNKGVVFYRSKIVLR